MKNITSVILILVAFCITESLSGLSARLEAGTTKNPWPSVRHDLLNGGAAPDFGYPTTPKIAWKVNRSDRPDKPGTPAGAGGAAAVDKGMVFTTGQGIVEARDQYTGNLIWSKAFPWTDTAVEPADTPDDWCYGDIPTLGSGNTGVCYVPDLSQCPSWCLQCTTVKPDCSSLSVINPLRLGEGYGQFISSPTLDTPGNLLAFGTFDGRVIALNMETGSTVWERTPFKDPGGPNEGRPWYDQKFAWHLSAPSIADGHVYIGSFLPSFYYIFRYPPFGKAIYGSDFHTYWMGHDGWFYALDENDGSILWTWNPQGCGVANVPPVDSNGNVYAQDDFHTTTCNGLLQSFDSNGNPRWTLGPVPVAQGGSPSISGSTIFIPMSDGVLWALDKDSGALKWTYHGGFCIKGNSGLTSSTAVDERHGWVLGASDTGHLFVLDKKTGRLVREAYLGVPEWKPGDNIPQSGFWFPGAGSMAIVPSQKLLYIAGTDYERAWQGQFTKGKEKLFCYYYGGPGAKLNLLWEYQFCLDDDACADLDSQHIVRGWEEQSSSFYNVPSPALADGHVYYNSMNGKVYCFGRPFRSTP
jgi:outer membrane protein assembly factor BamB